MRLSRVASYALPAFLLLASVTLGGQAFGRSAKARAASAGDVCFAGPDRIAFEDKNRDALDSLFRESFVRDEAQAIKAAIETPGADSDVLERFERMVTQLPKDPVAAVWAAPLAGDVAGRIAGWALADRSASAEQKLKTAISVIDSLSLADQSPEEGAPRPYREQARELGANLANGLIVAPLAFLGIVPTRAEVKRLVASTDLYQLEKRLDLEALSLKERRQRMFKEATSRVAAGDLRQVGYAAMLGEAMTDSTGCPGGSCAELLGSQGKETIVGSLQVIRRILQDPSERKNRKVEGLSDATESKLLCETGESFEKLRKACFFNELSVQSWSASPECAALLAATLKADPATSAKAAGASSSQPMQQLECSGDATIPELMACSAQQSNAGLALQALEAAAGHLDQGSPCSDETHALARQIAGAILAVRAETPAERQQQLVTLFELKSSYVGADEESDKAARAEFLGLLKSAMFNWLPSGAPAAPDADVFVTEWLRQLALEYQATPAKLSDLVDSCQDPELKQLLRRSMLRALDPVDGD